MKAMNKYAFYSTFLPEIGNNLKCGLLLTKNKDNFSMNFKTMLELLNTSTNNLTLTAN